MSAERHDLIVIGGGPGGYVAAIRGAQLGLKVALVEKEAQLGGTCLRVGCIPSKALLHSSEVYADTRDHLGQHGIKVSGVELDLAAMMTRKDKVVAGLANGIKGLLRKQKITRLKGHGRMTGAGKVVVLGTDGERTLQAESVVLATGSKVKRLRGVELDWDKIGTSTEALRYAQVPEHLVVIGAGVIGLELGSVWMRLGAKVTVLEYLDRILPGVDAEIASEAQKIFRRQGMAFRLGTRVDGARLNEEGSGAVISVAGEDPIVCDRVLVAVGREPNTDNLGLEEVGVQTNDRGRVIVDGNLATTAPGVYAIGDVTEGAMLAHKAQEEGVAVVEHIVTGHGHVNYDAIPSVVYTNPEVASVGKTEEELTEAGVAFKKGVFPFQANGRAHTMGNTAGKVKVLADARTDRILGVHMVGPRAGDLIAEVAVSIEFCASSEDLARAMHAHPSLSEAIKEAALATNHRALHL